MSWFAFRAGGLALLLAALASAPTAAVAGGPLSPAHARSMGAGERPLVAVNAAPKRAHKKRHAAKRRAVVVDAPTTQVYQRGGHVVVDAPFTHVRRSSRGVHVVAPFVNLYVRR